MISRIIKWILIGTPLVLLIAWGGYVAFFKPDSIPLPAVKPLTADIQNLYGLNKGTHKIKTEKTITLSQDNEELTLTVFAPDGTDKLPLILFSHGNFSDRLQYNRLIHHWVSHGYIVIAPDHLDSGGMVNGIMAMMTHGQVGVMKQRPKDMSFILDNLNKIKASIPALKDRIDASRVAATGHSFGAFVAQMMAGATAVDPETKEVISSTDPRIQAVVAISPPGPMFDMITSSSWDALAKPQLVTTGTWDVEPQFFPQWELHAMSYRRAPAGKNYLNVTQGADHYLGNLICRLDRDVAPQHEALKMILSSTTAFLDAYIKKDPVATTYLNTGQMTQLTNNFSTLSKR